MDILTIVLSLAEGICIGTGIIYLFIGLSRRDDERLHLTFALFALAYAGANISSLLEYKATSLEHFMQIGTEDFEAGVCRDSDASDHYPIWSKIRLQ
jgi:mannitol/fructose-specific phosphotransferase system IIA component